MSRFVGLIAAAGSGVRLGRGEPKAVARLSGRPLLAWTLDVFVPLRLDRLLVTAPPDRVDEFAAIAQGRAIVVAGGETRSASVRLGIAALRPDADDVVAVHDAARPFLREKEIRAVLEAAEKSGAAIAAIPVTDTIKQASGGRIVRTLDRAQLWAAATPQAFRGEILARALASGKDATDEASLCEDLGIPVDVVAISRLGFKITTPEDFEIAEAIVQARSRSREE